MSITFGSVGDIIATIQVAAQLLQALSESRGSAREFQNLVIELRTFHRALDQLLLFWQTRKQCPQLEALGKIMLPVVADCQTSITKFLDTIITKYGKRLTHEKGTGCDLKRVGKMIQWRMFEPSAVAQLHATLSRSKETILMVSTIAQGIAEEKDSSLISERISTLMDKETEINAVLERRLDKIEDEITEQSKTTERIHSTLESAMSAISLNATTTSDIQSMVARIYKEVVIERTPFDQLNPWAQKPVILEDALGWSVNIPLEIVTSWNTLHSILCDRFSNNPGFRLVQKRQYVIQDELTGQELRRYNPVQLMFHPGQKVNMSLVFHSHNAIDNICPRCKTPLAANNDSEIKCENEKCSFTFRQVIDITEAEEVNGEAYTNDKNQRAICDEEEEEEDCFDDIHIRDAVPENLISSGHPEDSPEIFKRVRMITSWLNMEDSRGSPLLRLGSFCFWSMSDLLVLHALRTAFKDSLVKYKRYFGGKALYRTSMYKEDFKLGLWFNFEFIGINKTTSRPALILFSEDKGLRQRAFKIARGLSWLKPGSHFLVLTASGDIFLREIKKTRDWKALEEERRTGKLNLTYSI